MLAGLVGSYLFKFYKIIIFLLIIISTPTAAFFSSSLHLFMFLCSSTTFLMLAFLYVISDVISDFRLTVHTPPFIFIFCNETKAFDFSFCFFESSF